MISELERVAKSVPAPSRSMMQRRPNCVSWVDNVLYQLKRQNGLLFNPDFEVPEKELSMVG